LAVRIAVDDPSEYVGEIAGRLDALSLQVSISDAMTAQCSASPSEPSAFLWLSAIGRIERSTALLSMAFLVESDGQQLLIWSDAFLHYVVSIQQPDWHADFDDDRQQAVATRKRLLKMAAEQRLLVADHHMPFPGLGYIESANGSFRWLPVSYQLNV
jgi:hypothetical protein